MLLTLVGHDQLESPPSEHFACRLQKMQAAASALDEESGSLELQIAAAARDTATAASSKAKLLELLDRVQTSADSAAADLDAQGKQRKEIEVRLCLSDGRSPGPASCLVQSSPSASLDRRALPCGAECTLLLAKDCAPASEPVPEFFSTLPSKAFTEAKQSVACPG